jgi:DNA mismatch repair protein MutS
MKLVAGTSTFDGLALAGGIATHLHDKSQSFTLFATHYFELTEFPVKHRHAVNVHVSAAESSAGSGNGGIVFLHEIQAGPAAAVMEFKWHDWRVFPTVFCNMPSMLCLPWNLAQASGKAQVDLFAPPPEPIDSGPSPLEAKLSQIDPDTLSPRDALDALYQLKKLL